MDPLPDPPRPGALRDYLETLLQSETASDDPVYVISVAADLVGVHAQTLRHYERVGLIEPARSGGNIRLFSARDVLRLRAIALLTADLGINLAGVEAILAMRRQIEDLQDHVAELQADLRAIRGFLLEDHRRRLGEGATNGARSARPASLRSRPAGDARRQTP
jgi:MerR family transcriptional regulator, heat shock protein HspR